MRQYRFQLLACNLLFQAGNLSLCIQLAQVASQRRYLDVVLTLRLFRFHFRPQCLCIGPPRFGPQSCIATSAVFYGSWQVPDFATAFPGFDPSLKSYVYTNAAGQNIGYYTGWQAWIQPVLRWQQTACNSNVFDARYP